MQKSYIVLFILVLIIVLIFFLLALPYLRGWDCGGFMGTTCPKPFYYCQNVADDIGRCQFAPWKSF